MFGIHLIHNRAQCLPEGVKFIYPVLPGQAEDPLQIVDVYWTVVFNQPGQLVP